MQFFLLATLHLVMLAVAKCENVPVFIWTNIRNPECVSYYGHTPGENVQKIMESDYMKCLLRSKPQEIKLFVTNKLSQDVFSHQDTFNNLKSILNNAASYQAIPSVNSQYLTTDVQDYLREKADKDSKILVHTLPDVDFDGDLIKSISTLDEDLMQTTNSMKQNYVAIFTAENSDYDHSVRVKRDTGRQLLQATTTTTAPSTGTFVNGTCVYIYFYNVSATIAQKSMVLTLDGNSTICDKAKGTADVTLNFKSSDTSVGTVVLKMNFINKLFNVSMREWWYLAESTVTASGVTYTMNPNLFKNVYSAPSKWSWVCRAPTLQTASNIKAAEAAKIQFNTTQIEVGFGTLNSTKPFNNVVDCDGFLTAGIWTGIVVMLLFLLIFTFGMGFLMSVSTMDKFDDPKGKMIITHTKD